MDGRCIRERAEVTVLSQKRAADGSLAVVLRLSPAPDAGAKVAFMAAAPPERRASFTGSCLPYANETQAFDGGRAMRGHAAPGDGDSGEHTLRLAATPNAYYVGLGTVLVPPSVFVSYPHRGQLIRGAAKLSDGVPFRTLTYPALRGSASFYDTPVVPVRSQQSILFASAFPDSPVRSTTPSEFWGGKPAV